MKLQPHESEKYNPQKFVNMNSDDSIGYRTIHFSMVET